MPPTEFSGLKVLVVGDIILDCYVHSGTARMSPEAPVPILQADRTEHRLGGAANVARQVAALGAKADLVGLVGHDYPGDILSDLGHDAGIDRLGVFRSRHRPTTCKTRYLANGQQVMRLDNEVARRIDHDPAHDRLETHLQSHVGKYDVVIVQDYGKGVVSGSVLSIVSQQARSGTPLVADPKPDTFHHYDGFDYITPNEDEFRQAYGYELDDAEIARSFLGEIALGGILVTRGARGATLYYAPNAEGHAQAPVSVKADPVRVTDVTGAGDTAVAVFALVLASRKCEVAAMHAANHAGGAVVGQQGCGVASIQDLFPGGSDDRDDD